MIRGSCLCGGVAFEASNPLDFRNCHCSRCRKQRGAAYAPNIFVKTEDFRWLRGEDLLITYRLPTAERFGNVFCRTCGSPMPRHVTKLDRVVIPAGPLDDDPGIRATSHIFVGSKAPWHEVTDGLPQHETYRPSS